eukprot:TRINITY_DN543_c1_g1_i1.p1 TRINITY_DN543_c1_g1~~TRINITY_DN543_c1_g1_i1.p1  ORF type:complete len:331 (+),score=81.16 TRINITY_DN543_c1_g1_i1:50-1042(+)
MLKSLFFMATVGMASGVFVPKEMRTCSTHTHCRAFGDTGATCQTHEHPTGMCTCTGPNYVKIKKTDVRGLEAGDQEVSLCVSNTEATSTTNGRALSYIITITFTDAFCSDIETIEKPLQFVTDEMLGSLARSKLTLSCSVNDNELLSGTQSKGVNLAILAELQIVEIYSEKVIRFIENMQIQLDRYHESKDEAGMKLGRVMKNTNMYTSGAANLMCPNSENGGQIKAAAFAANMLTTATFDDVECKAIECDSDYVNVNGVCLLPTPVPPSTDDDLSDGQIAGVVVGCVVAFILIIVFIVWFCCCRKEEEEIHEDENDEEAPKTVETSPDA